MLADIFETLGFKEEEAKTYLALLESGPKSVGDLAKITGQPRPTLYGHLEKLATSHLAAQSVQAGVKIFAAEPPSRIRALYRRKIMEMRTVEQSLDQILPELENMAGLNLLRPRLNFFEGQEALQAAMEDILRLPAGSKTYAFWPVQAALEAASPAFIKRFHAARIKKDIHVLGLWQRGQGADIAVHPYLGWGADFKRELRYAPLGVEFTMGYWVYGNRVLFLSARGRIYGFTIESAEMADLMTTQHQAIWGASEPVPFNRAFVEGFLKEIAA